MNKSSSKLMALLLVVIMMFNIMPVTAFAYDSPGLVTDPGTGYAILPELDTGTPPSGSRTGFTVRYVLKKEYTYNNQNLVVLTREAQSGNPAEYSPETITGCGTSKESHTWDEESKTLTFYPVPNTCTIELRYMLIFEKANGELDIRTFQQIGNGEAGLVQHADGSFETIEFKKFNGGTDQIVISNLLVHTIQQLSDRSLH